MKVITYLNKLTPENNKVYVFKTTIDEAIIYVTAFLLTVKVLNTQLSIQCSRFCLRSPKATDRYQTCLRASSTDLCCIIKPKICITCN